MNEAAKRLVLARETSRDQVYCGSHAERELAYHEDLDSVLDQVLPILIDEGWREWDTLWKKLQDGKWVFLYTIDKGSYPHILSVCQQFPDRYKIRRMI